MATPPSNERLHKLHDMYSDGTCAAVKYRSTSSAVCEWSFRHNHTHMPCSAASAEGFEAGKPLLTNEACGPGVRF